MKYLMLTGPDLDLSPVLQALVAHDCPPTQAQYDVCSYAVPEDHPNLALILLCVPDPDWTDISVGFEPGIITALA